MSKEPLGVEASDGGFVGSEILNKGFDGDKNFVGSGEILGNLERVIDDKLGFHNVEVNGDGVIDSGAKLGNSKGLVDEVGHTDVEMGFSSYNNVDDNPIGDHSSGREVKVGGHIESLPKGEKTIDGNVAEVHVFEGEAGISESTGVNLVVDLDVCVRKDMKGGKIKGGFCASDLVWAKVRSHPWWPGQIFEPGDASDEARKHFRSKSYLVAYFGDHTFAWNDEGNLKPFAPHFSQMVTQTSKEAFRRAVNCVLDEVSRRVEFGLSCHCIAGHVYDRLKTQVVDNAGIQELSSKREGRDRFFTVSSFEPVKFLDYVRSLAQGPLVEVDRLEHVMAAGQMSALYRWKGCYHLAEFGSLIGHLNNEADAPNSIIEAAMCKMSDPEIVTLQTKEEHGSRSQRRKNMVDDSCHSSKKLKPLSDLMVKKGSKKQDEEDDIEEKIVIRSSSYARKRKAAKMVINSSKTEDCSPHSQVTVMAPRDSKPSFSVGESILRVAGQLSQPSPLLKVDVSSHGKTTKAKGSSKSSQRKTKVVPAEDSFNEILSELHNAAVEPLRGHQFLSSMAGFFSDFRKSVVPDFDLSQQKESDEKDAENKYVERPAESEPAAVAQGCSSDSKSKEKAIDSEITTTFDFGDLEHAHCTDKVVGAVVQQSSSNDGNEVAAGPEPLKRDDDFTALLKMDDAALSSGPHTRSESVASEGGQCDEKLQQDNSPTALTLKFADMDSIPSEAQLNKIFSQFGPLKESETYVLANKLCARVVFKRRKDAETAFSTSGKFETFGPSLVCYRLNYAPPCKSTSVGAKRRKKDESLAEEVDSLLETKASVENNQVDTIEGGAQIKQSNLTGIQRPKKSGKCNLRKSLAWDSAFFTSAGVLEPEELSSIMEEAGAGVKKKPLLPGIQEDLSKSTDSISTFESDLTLETLEADLFSDIRASIQRCSKPSTRENFNDTKIHDGESRNGSLTKVADTSSGNMVKPKLPSKKHNPVVQPPLKSSKPSSDCKQVTKPAVRNREASSSLPRRAEAAGKPSLTGAAANKRMSVSAGRAKLESHTAGNLKAGKAPPLLKAPQQAENTAPKKMAASKSSLTSSVFSKGITRSSRSSCDSSSSSSSEIIHNSLTDVVRKKMEKNSNLPVGSKTRAPSRVAVKSKSRTGNSNLSDYLKSTTKRSSNISPASSISEWSTESCSSTATVEQKHMGLKPGSCSSKDNCVDKSVSQNLENYESFSNQSSMQASTETTVSHTRPGFAKPSGLRMPSAKIGFFDGVKAGAKTPSTSSRSRSALPGSLPRSTAGICTPSGSVNKTKLGNTSAKVTPIIAGTAKPESSRTAANIKPAVHLEFHSTALQKASSAQNADVISDISCELLDGGSPNLDVGKNGKVIELVDEKKHVANSVSGLGEGTHTQVGKANPEGKLLSTNHQASVVAEDGFNIPDMSDQPNNISANPSRVEQKEKCDIISFDNPNSSLEVGEADGLENVNLQACQEAFAKNQVDGQVKCMETIDSKLEVTKETDGDFRSQNVTSNENSVCSAKLTYPKLRCDDDNQTESAHSVSYVPCSLPLICLGANPGIRTPFAVKNSGSDILETCASSSESAVDALMKVDTLPHLQEPQKENI